MNDRLPMTSLPDIVLGPGGMVGFYSLGICHYLVNHFDVKDKKMVGFSAGSFNLIFMRLNAEKRNNVLQELFKCKESGSIYVVNHLMKIIKKNTVLEDYDLSGSSIAVSHTEGIGLYDTFLNIDHLVRCCKSSSLIPFVTDESLIGFYNNQIAMDGVLYYNPFMDQYSKRPLVINPFMFGRYSTSLLDKIRFILGLHPLKKTSIYQMYIYGYQDSKKNHKYFEKYLKPISNTNTNPNTNPNQGHSSS
jgi:hypothetical protein